MIALSVAVALTFLATGLVGAWIGSHAGRREAGFLWGFILGPVGWLIPAGMLARTARRGQRPLRAG